MTELKLRRIPRFINNKSVIILVAYFCTSFIYSDFGISAIYGAAGLLSVSLISLVYFYLQNGRSNFINRIKGKESIFILVILMTILLNFLRVFSLNRTMIYYIIIAFSSYFILISNESIYTRDIVLIGKILVIFGSFCSIIIIFSKVFTDLYVNIISAIVTPESKEYIVRLLDLDYGGTIGSDVSLTAFGLVFGLYALLLLKKAIKSISLYIFGALQFLGLLLLGRRGELLVFLFTVCLYIVYWFYHKNRNILNFKKILLYFGIALLIVVVIIGILFITIPEDYSGGNRLIEMISDIKRGEDISNGRFVLYGIAIGLFVSNPVFGIGWGKFADFAILSGNTHVRNVHCVYLQLLTETGIVGTTIIVYSLFHIFIQSLKMLKSGFSNDYAIRFGVLVQIFFLLNMIMDNSFLLPYFWMLYIPSILMLFSYKREEAEGQS